MRSRWLRAEAVLRAFVEVCLAVPEDFAPCGASARD